MHDFEVWYRINRNIVPVVLEKRENKDSGIRKKRRQRKEANGLHNRPARILIIEDELIVAENLKEVLEEKGFKVAGIVASGEEAIEKFSLLKPDLIVMDIRLAGNLDGIQTAIEIHSTGRMVPILFLTAFSKELFPHLAALPHNRYRYLSKLSNPEDLIASIERLLAADS